mgnify:CR=1 FL=1
MKLYEIISNLKFIGIKNYKDIDIDALTCTAQEKSANGMFFCIKGAKHDGHNFAQTSINNGAVCLVVERFLNLDVTQILVEDVRGAMSYISSVFFETYKSKMKFVGITGTNGKTTTTFIIREILTKLNKRVGLIGTEGIYINNLMLPSALTTPDPIDLHKTIKDMENNGCEYCIMEVSAHAIALNKIDNIYFDVVGLTNITNDHLDFFINMENYIKCKASLFHFKHAKQGVAVAEQKQVKDIIKKSTIEVCTVGKEGELKLLSSTLTLNGTDFVLQFNNKEYSGHTNLMGEYNLSNVMVAVATVVKMGLDIKDVLKVINKAEIVVPGRFNVLNINAPYNVIIDYAHTPDGVRNILSTIKKLPINNIITVFGCGGDRDKTKRSAMGQVASGLSSLVVVTTDNPRNENPETIIDDIVRGNTFKNFVRITDRKTAIEYALRQAEPNDIVAILGKGAENYQEIKGVKMRYSDYSVVDNFFKQPKKEEAQI